MNDGLVNIAPDFTNEKYNFWNDNMQLSIMKPFSRLYNRDEDKNKRISSKEMVCVFFMCDPDPEKNKFYRIPYQERLSMLKETYYSDFDETDEDIILCLEEYPHQCLSAAKKALKEEIDSMIQRSKFIRNFDYENSSLTDIEKLDRIRSKTPALLKNYEEIESKFLKEKTETRIKGGRKKSKSEQKLL